MRLENNPEILVLHGKCSFHGGPYLSGVMSIIINQHYTVQYGSLLLESSVRSFKRIKCLGYCGFVRSHRIRKSTCGKCIQDIVLTGNSQMNMHSVYAAYFKIELGTSHLVVEYVVRSIIGFFSGRRQSECHNIAFKPIRDVIRIFNGGIDNEGSVPGYKTGKFLKRSPDVIQILEEIQMIFFYIKDECYIPEKVQKTVGIFAGFRDKVFRVSQTEVASY